MTRRFTVRPFAALVLSVAIVATACNSDEKSGDDPPAFSPDAAVLAPTEPSTATEPPAPTSADSAPPPASSPEVRASSAPANYGEVGPGYSAAHAALLAAGREIVDALLTGDAATAYARFSDELKGALPEHELEAALQELPGDRVHFQVRTEDGGRETSAAFDGRLRDGAISGGFVFVSEAPGTFTLERSLPADPAAPILGQWAGTVVSGGAPFGIAVVIESEGEELRGTIDIPDAALADVPLEDLGYEPAVRSGELLLESVLPFSPDLRVYTSEHAWGPSTLVMAVALGRDGTIVGVDQRWQASLPPDPTTDFTSDTEFRLPFDGVWWVSGGGPTEVQNHHVVAPSQRHGYDIVVWKSGGNHRGDGSRNEDYWAWGEPVIAPADGRIVAVLDGLEDNAPGVLEPEPHPAGNHVVLKTGAAEFVHLAQFQQDSIRVSEGDHVTAGTVLGLTGNSGNSSEPHIHIHLQDEEDFFSHSAIGLPLPFVSYRANGEPISGGSPVQGELIQHVDRLMAAE